MKKTRASGRNVSRVFNPVVKLVLENQPFLMPEPAEKPSLQFAIVTSTSPLKASRPSTCILMQMKYRGSGVMGCMHNDVGRTCTIHTNCIYSNIIARKMVVSKDFSFLDTVN